jgi:hypothetical protein
VEVLADRMIDCLCDLIQRARLDFFKRLLSHVNLKQGLQGELSSRPASIYHPSPLVDGQLYWVATVRGQPNRVG